MGRNILPSKICNNEIKWKREKGDGERKIETEREKAKERKVVEKNKRRRYKRTHFFCKRVWFYQNSSLTFPTPSHHPSLGTWPYFAIQPKIRSWNALLCTNTYPRTLINQPYPTQHASLEIPVTMFYFWSPWQRNKQNLDFIWLAGIPLPSSCPVGPLRFSDFGVCWVYIMNM